MTEGWRRREGSKEEGRDGAYRVRQISIRRRKNEARSGQGGPTESEGTECATVIGQPRQRDVALFIINGDTLRLRGGFIRRLRHVSHPASIRIGVVVVIALSREIYAPVAACFRVTSLAPCVKTRKKEERGSLKYEYMQFPWPIFGSW